MEITKRKVGRPTKSPDSKRIRYTIMASSAELNLLGEAYSRSGITMTLSRFIVERAIGSIVRVEGGCDAEGQ